MIYSRTSMYPGQRRVSGANSSADTEARVDAILAVATGVVGAGHADRRSVVFPVFIAGVATAQPDAKGQAIDLVKALEGGGIGQNTTVVRKLLVAVCEEQRRTATGDVDWLGLAADKGLSVINCGL